MATRPLFVLPTVAPARREPISVVLSNPERSKDDEQSEPPHNELVLSVEDRVEGLTVAYIKKTIAETHSIPEISIALFRDANHTIEYTNNEEKIPTAEGLKIYWAFIGDAPYTWLSKKNDLSDHVFGLVNQITEQLDTSCFFLENDFYWPDGTTHNSKKTQWASINKLPDDFREMAKLPVKIENGKYLTTPQQLEHAYNLSNVHWQKTKDEIVIRITNLRTDKLQYEKNLESLRLNDTTLRNKVHTITGKLYPPFPDTALYSSIFKSEVPGGIPDLTITALFTAIESNTIYYHQELGKYNQLKKLECHLMEKYQQIMTRMKLWIARERIRLIAWELFESTAYEDELWKITLKPPYELPQGGGERQAVIERSYQCIDFCQCEAGCSNLIRSISAETTRLQTEAFRTTETIRTTPFVTSHVNK